jgi:hypothetical protein
VTVSTHVHRENRSQSSVLTCCARLDSGWLAHVDQASRGQRSAELTPTERIETRAAPSTVVPATKVADSVHADQANRGQSSALSCCARHCSVFWSPRRRSEQRSEQCPHVSSSPPRWLAKPTPTKLTESRATLSLVVPSTSGWLSPRRPSDQRPEQAFTCRVSQHRGWLSPHPPSEQRTVKRSHLLCTQRKWLSVPTPTKRTEARATPSPVVLTSLTG